MKILGRTSRSAHRFGGFSLTTVRVPRPPRCRRVVANETSSVPLKRRSRRLSVLRARFLCLLAFTGARIGEMSQVTWGNWDRISVDLGCQMLARSRRHHRPRPPSSIPFAVRPSPPSRETGARCGHDRPQYDVFPAQNRPLRNRRSPVRIGPGPLKNPALSAGFFVGDATVARPVARCSQPVRPRQTACVSVRHVPRAAEVRDC